MTVAFLGLTAELATAALAENDKAPPAPVNRASAEHYVWGEVNDGWHLLKDPSVSVIEERMSPGGEETPHKHEKARQFFYVLEGVLTMRRDGGEVALNPGDGVEVPPGLAHQAVNSSAEDVRFLVISTPPSHGDRINVTD
ncbi:MAG: cupin domain-containing protein [Pseudomonadota bacterium]